MPDIPSPVASLCAGVTESQWWPSRETAFATGFALLLVLSMVAGSVALVGAGSVSAEHPATGQSFASSETPEIGAQTIDAIGRSTSLQSAPPSAGGENGTVYVGSDSIRGQAEVVDRLSHQSRISQEIFAFSESSSNVRLYDFEDPSDMNDYQGGTLIGEDGGSAEAGSVINGSNSLYLSDGSSAKTVNGFRFSNSSNSTFSVSATVSIRDTDYNDNFGYQGEIFRLSNGEDYFEFGYGLRAYETSDHMTMDSSLMDPSDEQDGGEKVANFGDGELTFTIDYANERFYVENSSTGNNLMGADLVGRHNQSEPFNLSHSWGHQVGYTEESGTTYDDISIGGITDENNEGGDEINSTEIQVVDQDGNAVPNATVEMLTLMESGFDESDVRSIEEQAESVWNNVSNPFPDDFAQQFPSITNATEPGAIGNYLEEVNLQSRFEWDSQKDVNGQYVLPFNADSFASDEVLGSTTAARISGSTALDSTPDLILDEGGKHFITVWNGAGSGGDNQIDNSYPGGLVSDSAVYVEKLSPTGEVVGTWGSKARRTLRIKKFLRSDTTRDVVELYLQGGHFYRITPMDPDGERPDSPKPGSIVVAVGDPSSFTDGFVSEAEDTAGELTERAEELKDLLNETWTEHEVLRTGPDGTAQVSVPSNSAYTTLAAHAGPNELLSLIREEINLTAGELPTLSEVKAAAKGDLSYNGSIAVSTGPTNISPSTTGTVEVPVRSVPYQQFGDIEAFMELQRWLEQLAMGDLAQLPPAWEEKLAGLNESQLRSLHQELRPTVVGLPDALQRFLDRYNLTAIPQTSALQTQSQLRNSIVRLASILETTPSSDPCVGDLCVPEIDDELFNLRVPVSGEINVSASSVLLHWSDGSPPEPMPEDYWSVEDSSSLNPFDDGQTLVIEDFPIEEFADGRPLANVRPNIVLQDDDGDEEIIRPDIPIRNPAFSGSIPKVNAWDVNKLRPGPNQHVTVDLRSDDEAFAGVTNATVFDPSGNQINATLTDGTVSFTSGGEGAHTVEVTYEDTTGGQFVGSIRLRVRDQPVDEPPTLRFETILGQTTAVVGSDLRSATFDRQTDEIAISVTQDSPDSPIGTLHLHGEEQIHGTQDVSLSVLHPNGQNVQSNVNVNLHTSIAGSTLLYRGSDRGWGAQAITHAGTTSFGDVRPFEGDPGDRGKRVIQTYTNADGTLELQSIASPGIIDRIRHWLAYSIPSLPSVGFGFGWLLPVSFALFKRRNGGASA